MTEIETNVPYNNLRCMDAWVGLGLGLGLTSPVKTREVIRINA